MVDIDRIFITYYFKRIIITNEDLIFGKISRNFFVAKISRSKLGRYERELPSLPFPSYFYPVNRRNVCGRPRTRGKD